MKEQLKRSFRRYVEFDDAEVDSFYERVKSKKRISPCRRANMQKQLFYYKRTNSFILNRQ